SARRSTGQAPPADGRVGGILCTDDGRWHSGAIEGAAMKKAKAGPKFTGELARPAEGQPVRFQFADIQLPLEERDRKWESEAAEANKAVAMQLFPKLDLLADYYGIPIGSEPASRIWVLALRLAQEL